MLIFKLCILHNHHNIYNKKNISRDSVVNGKCMQLFNRPGVAGDFLQTALSINDSFSHDL